MRTSLPALASRWRAATAAGPLLSHAPSRCLSSTSPTLSSSSSPGVPALADWATIDPEGGGWQAYNLVNGSWTLPASCATIPDPLTGAPLADIPATTAAEVAPFSAALAAVPKSGLHNAFKRPDRYVHYGSVTARAAAALAQPDTHAFFTRLVQRTSPKSTFQAAAEVTVTRRFLENFAGDAVRFTASGFTVPGDHAGQASTGHRWPYGGVGLVTPFNFPIEIPALQALGALYMGNRPLIHVDARVAIVFEQFLRLLHACGMEPGDADLLHAVDGRVVQKALVDGRARSTLFTGSRAVAERLSSALGGRVFLEDAGFDWKVLGPDGPADAAHLAHAAWVADQDAYACSGQKCSAQSMLFMHESWEKAGFEAALAARAGARKLADLTVGPVLTWSTDRLLEHVGKLLSIPGARLAWGGTPLPGPHTIPPQYGAITPTAVWIPLASLADRECFEVATTEVFGPVQVLTTWKDGELPAVLSALESMDAHLTAAVVSRDATFINTVLGATVNGTTYVGARARTTGAPQNHWFGPAGDPRAAGIGTREAIRLVWSCHREVIADVGPLPEGCEGGGSGLETS